jgi:hypothetical protein
MIEKKAVVNSGRVRVTFELPSALWADKVNLVGEFNDWDTTATPMTRDRKHDDWRVTVELPAGRRYLFRYLLDGQKWVNEWHADDYVETDDGLCNSVVDLLEPEVLSGVAELQDEQGRDRCAERHAGDRASSGIAINFPRGYVPPEQEPGRAALAHLGEVVGPDVHGKERQLGRERHTAAR